MDTIGLAKNDRRCRLAKIKKRKLSWNASASAQVVGYKLYWSEGDGVDYDSNFVKLGNVTEIVLPDDIKALAEINGPVEIGIAAIDEVGNESDLITLKLPYQLKIPQAPSDLRLDPQKNFHTVPAPEIGPENKDMESKSADQHDASGPTTIQRPQEHASFPWGKTSPTSA